jgi:hypothetical protein
MSRRVAGSLDSAISGWFAAFGRRVKSAPGPPAHPEQRWSERDYELAGLAALEENAIAVQVYAYYLQVGTLPLDIAQVKPPDGSWRTAYPLEREITVDPWGTPYALHRGPEGRFFIISGGPSKNIEINSNVEMVLESVAIGGNHRIGNMIVYAGDLRQPIATK